MDRNTTIGLVLIFGILVLFSYLNKPSQEQVEAAKRKKDSIALVQEQMAREIQVQEQILQDGAQNIETPVVDEEVVSEELKNLYGDFSNAARGEEKLIVLENNLLRLTVSTKGGGIHSVELKNYKRFDSTNLYLIEEERVQHNISFFAQNRNIKTTKA